MLAKFLELRADDTSHLFQIYTKTKIIIKEAGEMSLQLRELAAFPEDLCSISSLHMAVHNCL